MTDHSDPYGPMPSSSEDSSGGEFRNYARILWRRRWIWGLITLLGVLGGLIYDLVIPRQYSATAELLFEAPGASNPVTNFVYVPLTAADVQTEVAAISSAPVVHAVSVRLRMPAPPVKAAEVGQTNFVSITAVDRDSHRAASVANAYAEEYVSYKSAELTQRMQTAISQIQDRISGLDGQIQSLETSGSSPSSPGVTALVSQAANYRAQLAQLQLTSELANSGVQVATPAAAPATPIRPRPARDEALALAIGLAAGVAGALVLESLDDSVRRPDDLQRLMPGTPVLATIPEVESWRDRGDVVLVSRTDPSSRPAEAYRDLRTSLQFLGIDHPLRVVQFTSAGAAEGKTTTLANLAVMFSEAGIKAAVVCCDLRRPRVNAFFDLDNRVGFTSVLLGRATLQEALRSVPGVPGLRVLTSGPVPPNPAELLLSPRTDQVIRELRDTFDVVLVDSAPILPVTDAVLMAGKVDATVLVVRAGVARRHDLKRALEKLAQARRGLAGAVFNAERSTSSGGYSYSYEPVPTALRPEGEQLAPTQDQPLELPSP